MAVNSSVPLMNDKSAIIVCETERQFLPLSEKECWIVNIYLRPVGYGKDDEVDFLIGAAVGDIYEDTIKEAKRIALYTLQEGILNLEKLV